MKKIASFTIDHIKLQPGIYVSRKDHIGAYSGSSYGDNFIHQTALQTAVMEWLKTNAVVS